MVYATESTTSELLSVYGKYCFISVGSDSPDAKRQKSSGSPSVSSSSKVCLLLLSYISIHSSEAINIIREFYSHNFVIANRVHSFFYDFICDG